MEEYFRHFSNKFSKKMEEYATDKVFKDSRYLFVWREGKEKVGYCTHCGQISGVSRGYKHNDEGFCPSCQTKCIVKANGIKRGKMRDYAYFVFYEKSVIDPNVVVAYGIEAIRDYREPYHNVKTEYHVEAMYYFEMGNSIMFLKEWDKGVFAFKQHKTVFSLFSRKDNYSWWSQRRTRMYIGYSRESLERAVIGTPFQYSCYSSYIGEPYGEDMVKYLGLYSQYPCFEYLTKIGMEEVVKAKLNGNQTYSAIYWRGKTLPKVLRLPKNVINDIRKEKIFATPMTLRTMQLLAKERNGGKMPYEALKDMEHDYGYCFNDLLKLVRYTSLKKALTYIHKQFIKGKRHYERPAAVVTTWRDYISECEKLRRDISIESNLFPSNLYQAHQNNIMQIKEKEDAGLNRKIAVRLKKLVKKYSFTTEELFIRPAQSSLELIAEGNYLNHCVSRYAKQYAAGATDILFIRKTTEPDKPYYTLEICKDKIIQVRGMKNCPATEEVKALMKAFEEERLHKKPKKEVMIMIPA